MALGRLPARSEAPALRSWLYGEVCAAPPPAAVFGARVFSSNASARPARRASDWLCPSPRAPRPSQLARAVAVARAQRPTASRWESSLPRGVPGLEGLFYLQKGFSGFLSSSRSPPAVCLRSGWRRASPGPPPSPCSLSPLDVLRLQSGRGGGQLGELRRECLPLLPAAVASCGLPASVAFTQQRHRLPRSPSLGSRADFLTLENFLRSWLGNTSLLFVHLRVFAAD